MGIFEDYKKYNSKIHQEVKFTLFDKEFLIESFNHQKELERQIQEVRRHIKELEERLLKLRCNHETQINPRT